MRTVLKRFKVKNFRSIEESDWVYLGDNTCLVGTNEAGKTNLLLALWKLKPANSEPIVPLDDFPRHLYSQYQADNHSNDVFILADFILADDLQEELATDLKCDKEQIETVLVQRKYDGGYYISFPYTKIDSFDPSRLSTLLAKFNKKINSYEHFIKEDKELKASVQSFIDNQIEIFSQKEVVFVEDIESFKIELVEYKKIFGRKKNLPDFFDGNLLHPLEFFLNAFKGNPISPTSEIRKKVLDSLPNFVYYSDYGNLDSEIFLPRVIEDTRRSDLTESARAKARTLDVLFKYVKLSPQEIYELGNDTKTITQKMDYHNRITETIEEELTEEQIQEWADKKRERGVLLRSAATELTKSFKEWWLQGDYIFGFEADGQHFRINVSDSLRPEAIELEGRSRGLQWFFSFFLVFLVETKESHDNTVLLLDEPGLSLHPIAQQDLAKFFKKLSEDNQLIYTSHSPFLVDMENLANVKAVYVNKGTGRTQVSADLRYDRKDAEKSIYPVHAALGLTVSDILLLGCLPILVEGVSDQIYLNLIKRYLIANGKLKYSKELVFIPTGGVRGVGPISTLVAARDDELPYVFLDSDKSGKDFKNKLTGGKYKDCKDRVLEVVDFLDENHQYEVEDLIPHGSVIKEIDRTYRTRDDLFEDVYEESNPIVNQIEEWAGNNSIDLEEGWKVELARNIQNRFDKVFSDVDENLVKAWETLFNKFVS